MCCYYVLLNTISLVSVCILKAQFLRTFLLEKWFPNVGSEHKKKKFAIMSQKYKHNLKWVKIKSHKQHCSILCTVNK